MFRVLVALFALYAGGVAAAAPAPPETAIETATGLRYVVLKAAPPPERLVAPGFVEYRATLRSDDGVVRFDAAKDGPQVASIQRLARTMPGLARALLTTPIGETRRWWIEPAQLQPGYPGMPATRHVVDLTVLGNVEPVRTPADVAGPPAEARRTPSGLAYKVLRKGKGGSHPTLASTIEIHYSGWTPDGKVFDSSVLRDERAVFPLAQLIPGWQEGLPLMSPGDSYRFWVPGPLAYDNLPVAGAPKGMLVFDITLYSFH